MKKLKLLSLILAVLMLLPLVLTACRGDSPTIPSGSNESSSESESESGTGQDEIPTKTEFVVKEYYKREQPALLSTFHNDEMDNRLYVFPNRNKENPYMGELNILGYTVYPKEWIKEYAYYDRSKTLDVYYGITAVDYIEKIYVDSQTHEVIGFSVNLSDDNIRRREWQSHQKSDEELEEQAWEWFKAQTDDYASYELIKERSQYRMSTTFTFTRRIGGLETIDRAIIEITSKGTVTMFAKTTLGVTQNFFLDNNIDLVAVYQAVVDKAMSIYGYLMSISKESGLTLADPCSRQAPYGEANFNKVLGVLDGKLVLSYRVVLYYDAEGVEYNYDTACLYVFIEE